MLCRPDQGFQINTHQSAFVLFSFAPATQHATAHGTMSSKTKRDTTLHSFFISEGYIWDWITAAALIVINHLVPERAIKPIHRFFNPSDATIAYPYRENSVPSFALYLLVFVLPAVVVSVVAVLHRSAIDW